MADTIRPANVLSAKMGEVYATIDGKRYHCIHMTEMDVTLDIKKGEVNRLNTIMVGHKITSATGKYKGKQYFIEDAMRKVVAAWKDGGVAPVWEMEVINDDPSSVVGAQNIMLNDCMNDSLTLAKLSASDDFLEEDVEGTFDDFEYIETLDTMDGLEA